MVIKRETSFFNLYSKQYQYLHVLPSEKVFAEYLRWCNYDGPNLSTFIVWGFSHPSRDFTRYEFKGVFQLIVDTNSWLGCSFPKPFRPVEVFLTSKELVNKSIHSMSSPKRNDKFGFPKSRRFTMSGKYQNLRENNNYYFSLKIRHYSTGG